MPTQLLIPRRIVDAQVLGRHCVRLGLHVHRVDGWHVPNFNPLPIRLAPTGLLKYVATVFPALQAGLSHLGLSALHEECSADAFTPVAHTFTE